MTPISLRSACQSDVTPARRGIIVRLLGRVERSCARLALAALAWLATGAIGTCAPVGEVTGFLIEPISASSPSPCDTFVVIRGCHCCRWASGTEIGADWFNLFVMNDLSHLPLGYSFLCGQSGILTDATVCCQGDLLPPGKAVGFLVQGANLLGAGPLGFNSSGNAIPPASACP